MPDDQPPKAVDHPPPPPTGAEQLPKNRSLTRQARARRAKKAPPPPPRNNDLEREVEALVQTIAREAEMSRADAADQDRRKARREWFAVVLLAVTIVLLAVVAWQVNEMIASSGSIRDQAESAKKMAAAAVSVSEAANQSMTAVHRAWVAPRLAYLLDEPVVGKPLEIRIEYRNAGYEPADDVAGDFKALAIPPGELADGSEARNKTRAFAEQCLGSSQWSGGSVVYPTADSLRAYSVTFKLPDDLVDDEVARGDKLIVVQYCFRYRTYDIPRHSLVCYTYRKGASPRYGLDLCEFEQKAN